MSTVQSSTAAGLTGTTAPAATVSGTDIQDRFLKLLVTQMKNQDPLNPMDNAQITSQLAQISTVNGIQQLNTTMQSLSTSFLSAQSMQSTSLIGHTVLTDGSTLNVADGVPAYAAIELAQAADSVKVNIVSPAGNIVRQLDLGPQATGIAGFQWDGLDDSGAKVAAGSYTYQVAATRGGQKIDATTYMAGTVASVTLAADGAHLAVGGIGDLTMQQIKRIM
jgi:flagellar basal-body rod modification protein FlgD